MEIAGTAREPRVEESEAAPSSFRPTLVLMSGRALAFLATFFIPVVLSRVLDQATFGTYRQIFLIHGTVYVIAQFAMAESLFYFLPGAGRRGGAYVANTFLFLAVSAAVCSLALWAGASRIAGWLSNPALAGQMGWAALFIGLTLSSAPLEMVMIARKRYLPAALAYGISDLLRAACLLFSALLFGGLRALLVGVVIFAACRLGAAVVYMKRTFEGALRPQREAFHAQLAYAVPFGLGVVLDVLQLTLHQYAVSYYFDAAAFAVYSVGCLNIPLVDLVVGPAGNVMMVRMSEARARGRPEAMLSIWHDTTRKLALVVAPLVGISIVTAPVLIPLLFTDRYVQSATIFMIWSTGLLWSAFLTDGVLRVHADTRFMLLLSALKLAVNIALMAAFVGAFGLPGAVMVTLTATAVARVAALVRIKALIRVTAAELLPWRGLAAVGAAAALAAVPALLVTSRLPGLVLVLARGAAYAAAYVALAVLFGALSASELSLLRSVRWASPGARPGS